MYGKEIANAISVFNVVAVCAASFFAFLGVLTVIDKLAKSRIINRGVFFKAFCAASLAAIAFEATVFNFSYYLRFFSEPEIHTVGVSPEDPNIILMSDGSFAKLVYDRVAADTAERVVENAAGEAVGGSGDTSSLARLLLTFENLNRKITNVFADVVYNGNNGAWMHIAWQDEAGVHKYTKAILERFPHDNYALLQSTGKVSSLTLSFNAETSRSSPIGLVSVAVDRPVPFYFSGLRLFVISFLIFAVIVIARRETRVVVIRRLFDYEFDPANKKQNRIYAFTVAALILFSFVVAGTSVQKQTPQTQQYNVYLTDAIIAGRTYLDHGNPEDMLKMERPTDALWMRSNGYFEDYWMGDWAYYNGKYYCYFGVVPAVILYVPYKLITGNYLSNWAGVFLFCAIATVLMALLWRFCVKKYMPNIGFAFYLLSFIALFFSSGMFYMLRYTRFYSIVQSAAFMFAFAGILLLLKSAENENGVNRLKLFFSCLCFALIAGCRPPMVFIAFLVPVVLWKYRSLRLVPYIAVPVIMVAVPLCFYNYVRFGSITDFGQNYNMTIMSPSMFGLSNPLSNAVRTVSSILVYLFMPVNYSLEFPFIRHIMSTERILLGTIRYTEVCSGLVNFPIVFCLAYMFKYARGRSRPLLFALLVIAAVIMASNAAVVGNVGRYSFDFAAFIIIPSLFCAYYWCYGENGERGSVLRLRIAYILFAVSIFTGLCLFVIGDHPHYDEVLLRYLGYSLNILGEI